MTVSGRGASGRTGQGPVIELERWKRDRSLLRRLFPVAYSKVGYLLTGARSEKKHHNLLASFAQSGDPPLFRHVEVETQNRCNGICDFCPVNSKIDSRAYARMPSDLFVSIVDQLAAMKYRGGLCLYSNNEPLLDERLPDFATYARERLPRAFIKIYTNGTLLHLDLFRKLMPHMDRIGVNQYGTSPEIKPNLQEIYDYCLTEEGRAMLEGKIFSIQPRYRKTILSSRAGNAPNRAALKVPSKAKCFFPFRQLIIRPDGKISLCCNDALGQMTMGDASRDPLIDIWKNKEFSDVREKMVSWGRAAIPLCSVCDFAL